MMTTPQQAPLSPCICDACGEICESCPHCGSALHVAEAQVPEPEELDRLAHRRRAYRAEWRKETRPGVGDVLVMTFSVPYHRDYPVPGNTRGETARRVILSWCSAALRSAIKKIGNS